jgi:cell division protein FtsW (lipid II flippase)
VRWERVLAAPLVPAANLAAASAGMAARTFRQAALPFSVYVGLLIVFFTAVHILLRRRWPAADPFLLPAAALLSALGVLMLFALKDPVRDMPAYIAQAQGILFGGGFAIALSLWAFGARLPLHRYGYLYALGSVALTVLLGIFGSGPSGSRLEVAGAQPIELIKVLLVFFLAAYLAERGALLNDPLRRWGPFSVPRRADAMPLIVLYALPLALFALVRDLGPVLLLFGTFLLLLYLATGRAAYLAAGFGALVAGAAIGYRLHFGVFYVRVDMWRAPWNNTHKGGDQTALGLWGLASGGPWGTGLGLGGTRFIPRGGSDLAFASLGEELGLPGAILTTLCHFVFVLRGIEIARRAQTEFDRYLAAGLAILLGMQAAIILCGTLGLLPLAGITLPFVSFGKSSLIASYFCVGALLALSARRTLPGVVPGSVAVPTLIPAEFRRASRCLTVGAAVVFLPVLIGRLIYIQAIAANRIAATSVRVPDADGILRLHVNPRLAQIAARIPRGKILDRNGLALAATVAGVRTYPQGAATGHLIGYLDPAVGGPTGLEAKFDPTLRGFETYAGLVPVWRAKDLPWARTPAGEDVTLTLDAGLQTAVQAALVAGANGVRDRRTGKPLNRGAVVVLDVATGAVLASVTLPTYDPNHLTPTRLSALNNDPDHPLINRAVSGFYPPGSTFKIVTATALLSSGKAGMTVICRHIDENLFWHANGETYARRRVADDETDQPHGVIGMDDAIVRSCNIFYAHASLAVGDAALRQTGLAYGLTRLPSAYDMGANLPDIGFGQGPMLVSPTEMASVAQTVANGGVRLRPTYRASTGQSPAGSPLRPADAARLAADMLRVTQTGTAAGRFADLPFSVAGKTGTAQNGAGDRVAHSWFIGFAPADHPKVAFAVVVENGGYGAAVAVPVAHAILKAANVPAR